LRFVFDTNVLISAALSDESISRRAFDHALDRGTILVSLPVVTELNEVLSREKFRPYITEDEARQFLATFAGASEWVEIDVTINDCRDPSDNKFLELAVSGQATHIVTGDNDLLELDPFQGKRILTPGEFLRQIG
jgi:putative PIN family toxin of toxin-antitoxin system